MLPPHQELSILNGSFLIGELLVALAHKNEFNDVIEGEQILSHQEVLHLFNFLLLFLAVISQEGYFLLGYPIHNNAIILTQAKQLDSFIFWYLRP